MKVLHLTFHQGCLKAFENVSKILNLDSSWRTPGARIDRPELVRALNLDSVQRTESIGSAPAPILNLDLESWFIPSLKPQEFDGTTFGNVLYNIDHARAERIWNKHYKTFEKFDVIVTSDTAPLARIFFLPIIKNEWKKKLVIWICNRFDYYDGASLDSDFPDKEYYELFQKICGYPNVKIIGYTPFENYYAKIKGVNIGNLVIKPFFPDIFNVPYEPKSEIPPNIIKKDTFFLPPYHNETIFMNLSEYLTSLNIPNYCGRYNGPLDLKDFKGIIHLPYAWSNLALFENINLGIPYFIPSRTFLKNLISSKEKDYYFYTNSSLLIEKDLFDLSEWYDPDKKEIFIYFDSWQDLKNKIEMPLEPIKIKIKTYAEKHSLEMIDKWKSIF